MTKIEISEQLERGDIKLITQSTKFSESYVRKVLSGSGDNERDNDLIIKAAKMVIANRKSLVEQIEIIAEG